MITSFPGWHKTRVFVTGATGLVGGFVVQELLSRGADVICLVRDDVRRSLFDASAKKCTVVHGRLEDFDFLLRVINEYQVQGVFHLAAQTQVRVANEHPIPTLQANVMGSWNLLEAARQVRKHLKFFVVASSDKAYGEPLHDQYDEDHPLRAVYPYDVSKACTDLIARCYAKTYQLPVSVTRCGNFFGAGDLNWDRLVPHVIESLLANKPPIIRSSGKLVRDYFYVKDGALAYIHLAEKMLMDTSSSLVGEVFNFSYGSQHTVLELVGKISQLMGKSHIRPVVQNDAPHEIQFQSLDASKARRVLGWLPQYTLEAALVETIEWYARPENSSEIRH